MIFVLMINFREHQLIGPFPSKSEADAWIREHPRGATCHYCAIRSTRARQPSHPEYRHAGASVLAGVWSRSAGRRG
jgi:hypothetical protein